jgi:hypothetical protein
VLEEARKERNKIRCIQHDNNVLQQLKSESLIKTTDNTLQRQKKDRERERKRKKEIKW